MTRAEFVGYTVTHRWMQVQHEAGCPLEDTEDHWWFTISHERRAICTCDMLTITQEGPP